MPSSITSKTFKSAFYTVHLLARIVPRFRKCSDTNALFIIYVGRRGNVNWLKFPSNRRTVYTGAHIVRNTGLPKPGVDDDTQMRDAGIRRRARGYPSAAFILCSHSQTRCMSRSWLQSDFEINYYCNFACRRVPRTILRCAREKRQAPRFKATDSLADERRSLHGLCYLKISGMPRYVTMIK